MKTFLQKTRTFLEHRKKSDYIIMALIGVLLLIIVIPVKPSQASASQKLYVTKEKENELEQRLSDILNQMEGVGKADVMITRESNGSEIEGVLIVTKGADSSVVCQKITDAVMALFGIDAHKIKIVKMV